MITSGAVIQIVIEIVLFRLYKILCMVYVDGIIILGKTKEEHCDNLHGMLERLKEHEYKV